MYQNLSRIFTLLVGVCLASWNSKAHAITIDEFDTQQVVVFTTGSNAIADPNVIGGFRTLGLTVLGGGGNLLSIDQGRFNHAQGPFDTAISYLVWDGDINPAAINYTGLHGINLSQDGANSFLLQVMSFDFAFGNSMDLVLTVFDASDPTGGKSSKATIRLTREYMMANPETITIPFNSFIASGANGAASFSNVGAIKLENRGITQAIDLRLGFLKTNGICPGVPNNGVIIDQCGVCGGNNSTCKGCDGVPNSGKVIDQCGVCGGNGMSCIGCDGVPNSNKQFDLCGVCGGNNSTCKGCDGIPNSGKVFDRCGVCGGNGMSCVGCDGVPNSGKVFDQCGVCGGSNSTCKGCDGVPNSGKIIDQCGVCGGNSSSCKGCDGIPNSGKVVDACGVCGGIGQGCLGCDGIPNSNKIVDPCGVCGGNGSSCLDCTGTVNGKATLDRCNICNGDGTSCLDCNESNIKELLISLDSNARKQKGLVAGVLRNIKRLSSSSRNAEYIKKTQKQADGLYVESWSLVWSISQVVLTCANTTFCSTVSNAFVTDQYRDNSIALNKLLKSALKRLQKLRGRTTSQDAKLLQKGDALHQGNLKLTATLPSQSLCN